MFGCVSGFVENLGERVVALASGEADSFKLGELVRFLGGKAVKDAVRDESTRAHEGGIQIGSFAINRAYDVHLEKFAQETIGVIE
jgi:hypothetical protein